MTRHLPVFHGYTVDERLREFRKVPRDTLPEFIPFDSPAGGRMLLAFIATKTDDHDLWAGEQLA